MATTKNNLNERSTKALTLTLFCNVLILKMSNLFSPYFTCYRNTFIRIKLFIFLNKNIYCQNVMKSKKRFEKYNFYWNKMHNPVTLWYLGFHVGLEQGSGLLSTVWHPFLRMVRRHVITILICHGGAGSPALIPPEV